MNSSAAYPSLSWINGVSAEKISSDKLLKNDRGFQYGDGLFETILLLGKQLVLQKQHLERLERDCLRLKINLDASSLQADLNGFLGTLPDSKGVIKIIITRVSGERGYSFSKNSRSNCILQYFPLDLYPHSRLNGIKISLSSHKLQMNSQLAGIKHLNRMEQVMASADWNKSTYQECLMQSRQQYVVEGLFSNIFLIKDGRLLTADLSSCGVRGVMRDYILNNVCSALKINGEEKKISLNDVMDADEMFLCNSIYGVWPVTAFEVKTYPLGALTKKIQAEVHKLGYSQVYA